MDKGVSPRLLQDLTEDSRKNKPGSASPLESWRSNICVGMRNGQLGSYGNCFWSSRVASATLTVLLPGTGIIVQPTDQLEILLLKDGPALPRHWESLRKASPSLSCRQHMEKAKQ